MTQSAQGDTANQQHTREYNIDLASPNLPPHLPVVFPGYKYGFGKTEFRQNAFPDHTQDYVL